MRGLNGVVVAFSAALLLHCGQAADPNGGAIGDDSHVANTRQPFMEFIGSRPVAAAVERVVNGDKQLWVFVCTSEHVVKRRVYSSAGWGSWWTVNSTEPCDSTPTVGIWKGESPRESIGVYWHSTSNKLMEAWYDSTGGSSVTDLGAHVGLGKILGWPLVVHSINLSGASQRISVAVQDANRQAWTFDYYLGSWHKRRVVANGSITVAQRRSFTAFNSNTLKGSYLSFESDDAFQRVYTRNSWNDPYTEVGTTSANDDRMIIWGGIGFTKDPESCGALPCLIIQYSGVDRLPGTDAYGTGLQTGGNLLRTPWVDFGSEGDGTPQGNADTGVVVQRLSDGGLGIRFPGADSPMQNAGGQVDTAPSMPLRSDQLIIFYGRLNPDQTSHRLYGSAIIVGEFDMGIDVLAF